MLILTAHNIFTDDKGKSDYDVVVRINTKTIWHGPVLMHERKRGAAELLRLIADEMDKEGWHGKGAQNPR